LFAGDLEINLAQSGRPTIAHTNRFVIYDFWTSLFEDAPSIAKSVEYFYPFESEEVFRVFQDTYFKNKSPIVRSALFFLLNRCSSDGMISHGGIEQENYNPLALSYIRRFKQINFDVVYDRCDDFSETLAEIKEETDFIFIPVGKFSYDLLTEGVNRGPEESIFIHKTLKNKIDKVDGQIVINYKYHQHVLNMYSDYKSIILIDDYGRVTNNKEKAKEVIIANF
jgi:site-specific DNA-adenine methylase